ncbi:MAG: FkbM family methyltransferase [Paracoccaceae bacterium]|nr:FkbM family methyltransferase [Paracoccaceae bacterium]MDG2258010.1 FkbM family methyltransferase [Paracoccaceae bacterium]
MLHAGLEAHGATKSHAQLCQDLFALAFNGYKSTGYFVEFGATNGVSLSNSYILEKEFGWSGVLAEPDRNWHDNLLANRGCDIETRCVWKETGQELSFSSAEIGEVSTITEFTNSDHLAKLREGSSTYQVETISLNDLLANANAPEVIDYMSVDTEGSELEILNAFDFDKHKFNFVTIEHNYTKNRSLLTKLMKKNGYRTVFESLSRFDAWFVPE